METTIKHDSTLILKKTLEVCLYVIIFAIIVPSFFYFLGHMLDDVINPFSRSLITLDVSGIILIGCGGSILIMAIVDLGKVGSGLPASPVPPITLVTGGLYGLSRHPVYFGASLSFLGGSLVLNSFWSAVLSWPLFTLLFLAYALRIEEPVLEKRFNGDYGFYRKNVPLFWEFPLRATLFNLLSRFLSRISSVVNRPFILEYRSHFLFLGYGLWVGFGVFIGLVMLNIAFLAEGVSSSTAALMISFFTVASLAGSRFVSMVVIMILEKKTLKEAWYRVGFVSWGALLAAIISSCLFYSLTKKPLYFWFDAAFMGLMINHFFGRIGCLFYGCCYGRETRSPIHVHYTHARLKAVREGLVKTKILYPIQLYSSLCGLLTFVVVFSVWSVTSIGVGIPTSICCVLYGIFRFIEEWFRYQKQTVAGVLSPAQIVSLVVVLTGVFHLGWILPTSDLGYHPPLFQASLAEVFNQIHIWLVIGMGLLTAFVFSYHRYEIGSWGKLGIIKKKMPGGYHETRI